MKGNHRRMGQRGRDKEQYEKKSCKEKKYGKNLSSERKLQKGGRKARRKRLQILQRKKERKAIVSYEGKLMGDDEKGG